jgi:hypothetical protein
MTILERTWQLLVSGSVPYRSVITIESDPACTKSTQQSTHRVAMAAFWRTFTS